MAIPKPAQLKSPHPAGANGKSDIAFHELGGTRIPGPTGLKAIPGKKVAWDWQGHGRLTLEATKLDDIAADGTLVGVVRKFITAIDFGAWDVQAYDISWANVLGAIGIQIPGGQVIHFMRDEGQSELEAYNLSVNWIMDMGAKASQNYRTYLSLQQKKDPRFRSIEDSGKSLTLTAWQLAGALHTVQDSFTPAHVSRDSSLAITKIRIWDDENKKTHKRLDKGWKGSPLAGASTRASEWLIKCVAVAAQGPHSELYFRHLASDLLLKPYLRANLPPTTGRGQELRARGARKP
jgi:hypothetical protein